MAWQEPGKEEGEKESPVSVHVLEQQGQALPRDETAFVSGQPKGQQGQALQREPVKEPTA